MNRKLQTAFVIALVVLFVPLIANIFAIQIAQGQVAPEEVSHLAISATPERPGDDIFVEVFSEDGAITGTWVPKPSPEDSIPLAQLPQAEVIAVQETGPSANRFDLVFVGDGYTVAEMGAYSQHVTSKWRERL